MQQMGLPFVGDMMTQDPLLVDRTLEAGSKFVVSDEDLAEIKTKIIEDLQLEVEDLSNLQLWGSPDYRKSGLWGENADTILFELNGNQYSAQLNRIENGEAQFSNLQKDAFIVVEDPVSISNRLFTLDGKEWFTKELRLTE